MNNFRFQNLNYLQLKGTSIGRFGWIYAMQICSWAKLKKLLTFKTLSVAPIVWRHMTTIWQHRRDLLSFLDQLNHYLITFTFIWNISDEVVNLLNVDFFIETGQAFTCKAWTTFWCQNIETNTITAHAMEHCKTCDNFFHLKSYTVFKIVVPLNWQT